MAEKALPVYNIEHFKYLENTKDFYANNFVKHLNEHHFINTPHKHDFFLVFLFTKGKGTHEIDFNTYKIKPGALFLMSPGQIHNWQLSKDIDGYVFFHSQAFYDMNFASKKVYDLPFYTSIHNSPVIYLNSIQKKEIEAVFSQVLEEYRASKALKYQKLCALTDLIYIESSRLYIQKNRIDDQRQGYLYKLRELEKMIDQNYKALKFPKEYAQKMGMSEKHLNRICKTVLNKTTSDLISERILLEAKRILIHSDRSIAQLAEDLGYLDISYFTRWFKKKTGKTPKEFVGKGA
jgi:AraC family transcriptional activator of pobA